MKAVLGGFFLPGRAGQDWGVAWPSRRDVVVASGFYFRPYALGPSSGEVGRERAAGLRRYFVGDRRPTKPPRIPQRARSLGALALGTGSEEFRSGRVELVPPGEGGPRFENACASGPGRASLVLAKSRPVRLGRFAGRGALGRLRLELVG